jgi:Tfp pilus assembly protein PilF
MTTEQLLTELGKLVFAISKQLVVVTQKLESIDGVINDAVPNKLDRLAELIEVSNEKLTSLSESFSSGDAVATLAEGESGEGEPQKSDVSIAIEALDKTAKEIQTALDKGFGKVDSLDKKLVKIEKTFKSSGDKLVKGIADSGATAVEKMAALEESLSGIRSGTDSIIELVKKQMEEAEKIADRPPHEALVSKLEDIGAQVKKAAETIVGTIDEKAEMIAEHPPHPELVDKLADIDGDLLKVADGMISAVHESDDKRHALLEDKFANLSSRMDIFPDSVKTLGEKLTEKIEDFREEASKLLEEASGALEKSSSTLDSVEKIVTDSSEQQKESLGKMLELVERHRENSDNDEIDKLNSLAIRHFNNAEYNLAQNSIEKALMIDSDRPELWSNLAHVKAADNDIEGAEEAFRKSLQLDPDLDQAISGLGVLLIDAGRPQETVDFLKEFLEDETPSIRTMIAYGRALSATGRHSEAIELMNRAKELAPNNPEIDNEIARYSESGS